MMNNGNEISHHTKLYGFIGESAGQSSIAATLNKLFKANNKDAMMIPMNIREDDFYYTLVNMKKSHVNGALISGEYLKNAVEILDDASEVVKISGICDIVLRDGEKLIGDMVTPFAMINFLKNRGVKKVALIGIDAYAKAFCYVADGFEIGYFYDDLEKLMRFCTEIKIQNPDINRIADGMEIDFSSYDAVIDFSDFESFGMVEKLSAINVDMKSKKEFSPLRARAHTLEASYFGFDAMLDEISGEVFAFLKENKHLEHDKSDMRF